MENLAARFAGFMRQRAVALTLLFTILGIVGSFYTVLLYKELRTDLEELLPVSAPSVIDLKRGAGRFSGLNHIEVVIQSQDIAAAKRLQIDVANQLRKLPPDVAAGVKENLIEEQAFFQKNRPYYVELNDWRRVRTAVQGKISAAKRKAFDIGLGDDDEKPAELPIEELKKKYANSATEKFPDGYFASPDGHTRIVLAFLPGKVTDVGGNERLSEATTKIVKDLNPASYAADMKVGLGGDVQNVVEEHRELVKDLITSFVVVTVLVTLLLFVYFGTLSAVVALSFTLFVGTTLTFGLSFFAVGYLNANTAFLGSIVIGNGINFPIILLARYAALSEKGAGEGALGRAMAETWKPTLAAALAAGTSYGSLALTDFRGFSQFGVIGAIGMALCWLATYSVLPAALSALDRFGWLRLRRRALVGGDFVGRLAGFVHDRSRILAAVSLGISLVALVSVLGLGRGVIESDLSRLRNKWSMEHGSGYWGKLTDEVFGRELTPTVVLTESAADSARLLAKLKEIHAREGARSPFSSFAVIEDYFPADQAAKFNLMREISALLNPKMREKLKPDEQKLVAEFLPEPIPAPFAMETLPPAVIEPFKEKDGRLQTVVQAYPRLNNDKSGKAQGTWNGEEVIRYTALLREGIRESGVDATIIGQNPISADMLEAITKDGPKATAFAFGMVALFVIVLFPRVRQAAPVLISLLIGVLWMAGAIRWFGWKINFLNFIALPITFGIGVDYSVNIFGRYFQSGGGERGANLLRTLRETASAVILCSLTTTIGYGSLLLSGSQAFVSFGTLAVAGEIACILAAIFAVPAIWFAWLGRSRSPA